MAATIYPCMDRIAHRCRRRTLNRVPNEADDRLPSSSPTDRTTDIAANGLRRTPWYDGRGRRGGRRTQALCTITGELTWLQIKWANVGGRSTRVCATNKENTRAYGNADGFRHIQTKVPATMHVRVGETHTIAPTARVAGQTRDHKSTCGHEGECSAYKKKITCGHGWWGVLCDHQRKHLRR